MFDGPIQRLVDELARLPGVGRKSAQRLAFHLLNTEEADARRLAQAIVEMREQVRLCVRCFNVASEEECGICRDARRDSSLLCVVERAQDIIVIEKTAEFGGRYHVLGGHLSPIDGMHAEQLRIRELHDRVRDEGVVELIIATNPTVEGDATAMFIAREMAAEGLRITRLASGLPVGGDLDYADEITLGRAFLGRRDIPTG